MLVLDREAAIAAWRRAESRIYPSVMLNADLYQQYIGVVRAIAELLEDVRTEDDLVAAWNERRELVRRRSRGQPADARPDGPRGGARRRLLPPPPRDHARAGQGARARAARARAGEGAEWVVLFEDVTPLGSHRLEMHVASGRALHASSDLPLDASARRSRSRSSSSTRRRRLAARPPPVMPAQTLDTREEWEARIEQARSLFGRG